MLEEEILRDVACRESVADDASTKRLCGVVLLRHKRISSISHFIYLFHINMIRPSDT